MWECWTDPITTIVSLDMLRVGSSCHEGINNVFIGKQFIDKLSNCSGEIVMSQEGPGNLGRR